MFQSNDRGGDYFLYLKKKKEKRLVGMDRAKSGQEGPLPFGTWGYPSEIRAGSEKVKSRTSCLEVCVFYFPVMFGYCYCSQSSLSVAQGVEHVYFLFLYSQNGVTK